MYECTTSSSAAMPKPHAASMSACGTEYNSQKHQSIE